jgi:acyl transferase domain-containing protein
MSVSRRTASGSGSGGHEPIAIVGMACRFAGAGSVDELWRLIRDGVDATTETPAERYDVDTVYAPETTPGRLITRRGGYLPAIADFDAGFFGLSHDEATAMDPQQRLLMMTTWEALEDAGIPPRRLAGTRTAVFVGCARTEYWERQFRGGLGALHRYSLNSHRSLLSGRLSYTFDLRGPSVFLDTTCSSSSVALHLACQSLRTGESSTAIAAGVNLKLAPDLDVLFSQIPVIAKDGRCKFGDSAADGFAPSDGVGVVVLKPLGQARTDGDRIRAVIRGSAVSNDGASSGSLLAPSVEGYALALRWAYQDAGVDPADVDLVEAHGTGNPAIDVVELTALGAVLGEGRPTDRPCYVGSVKTNVGHPEGASGIASLIKAVLCLEHRTIPPSLHFINPTPRIDWNRSPLVVPTTTIPLPDRGRPAIAGVSGQGASAVNVHLVISEPPRRIAAPHRHTAGAHLLPVSARSAVALAELARRYVPYLRPGGPGHAIDLADICSSALFHRQHHEYRLAVAGATHEEVVTRLNEFLEHRVPPPIPDEFAAAARAYLAGEPIVSDSAQRPAEPVPLPTYPWQTDTYWA